MVITVKLEIAYTHNRVTFRTNGYPAETTVVMMRSRFANTLKVRIRFRHLGKRGSIFNIFYIFQVAKIIGRHNKKVQLVEDFKIVIMTDDAGLSNPLLTYILLPRFSLLY